MKWGRNAAVAGVALLVAFGTSRAVGAATKPKEGGAGANQPDLGDNLAQRLGVRLGRYTKQTFNEGGPNERSVCYDNSTGLRVDAKYCEGL